MRVLIADDNRDAVATFAALLKSWGFEPCVAYDGRTALARLREPDPPQLAILDWVMPGLTGIEICREIRADRNRSYTYFILVTGRGNRTEMVAGLSAGADEFLFKPVDPDELHARLLTGKRVLDLQDRLLATMGQLKVQATHDSLTGLWNRAAILEHLEREMARGQRHDQPLAVAMGDLDHFKAVNDTHGHAAGDQVLVQAAQRMRDALRPYDAIGRYGGEEFLLVLSNCDCGTARALAERLRTCIAVEPFSFLGTRIPVTISLGVASWDGQATATDLVRQADDILYRAKRAGRNCVASAKHDPIVESH
jgi:two-component system cell cycle response regulator